MRPVLQVALDLMHLKRAETIAVEAVIGGADWIEVGTPLLKSEGMDAVRAMRRLFPGKTVVADMKTMDVGGAEVEMAAKAGADVISVLGMADDGTIGEAVLTARQYGAKVMVDLIGADDVVARAKRAEGLGASYICLHVGVDEQMKANAPPMSALRALASELNVPIAAAGGLTAVTAKAAVEAGASIIVIGGAIIKAEDVTTAAQTMKRAIEGGSVSEAQVSRKFRADELRSAFARVTTCNVADAQHKGGVMQGIVPRTRTGVRLAGPALTVQTSKGDWAKPVEAIDRAAPGDVLVIDAGGSDIAVFGELAAWSCRMRGVAGVVIDGAIRDLEGIRDMDFPAFSRNVAPNAGEPKGFGGIGLEVTVGGQQVRQGDWIIGDDSGIVVVPQERAVEIANRSVDVSEREDRIREEIKRGGTLSMVQELERWEQVR